MTGHLIENEFSSYDIADSQVMEGGIFTTLQLQCIQNEIARLSSEKAAVPYPETADEYPKYFIAESFLRGKIAALVYLKAMSQHFVDVRADIPESEANN